MRTEKEVVRQGRGAEGVPVCTETVGDGMVSHSLQGQLASNS